VNEADASRAFFKERGNSLLTIAWNRGPEQILWVDDVPTTVPASAVVALTVNQTYRFEQPAHVVRWLFNREFYCIVDHDAEVSCVGLLFYGALGAQALLTSPDDQRRLGALLAVFEDEFETRDTIQGEMLLTLLKRLIILVTRIARQQLQLEQLSEPQLDLTRRFNLLVEQHYRRRHRVSEYAALLNKSAKTLANVFALHGDRTPTQVIQERIALEARRLLVYTDLGVKQIAADLGFADSATFSRFFKSTTGASPVEFRSTRGGLPRPAVATGQRANSSGG
jgi:AraC family transcriptional regulator, transcriptional activator of pobA